MKRKVVEVGTQFSRAYERAYQREQDRGRVALFLWAALLFYPVILRVFSRGLEMGWALLWLVAVVLSFIGMSFYWSQSAVHHRAHRSADRESV